jgi:hypothetical protein
LAHGGGELGNSCRGLASFPLFHKSGKYMSLQAIYSFARHP